MEEKKIAVQIFLTPNEHKAVVEAAAINKRKIRQFVTVAAIEKASSLDVTVEQTTNKGEPCEKN